MRFLGIGDTCDLGALYLRLIADGHEVRIFISEKECHGILAGMAERTNDWRGELPWIREAGEEGIILFENVAKDRGAMQDALRRDGFNVIGGSAYGDRLENDRAYAQGILAELGLPVCRVWEFADSLSGDAFLASRPGRYVLKFNGSGFASADNYVGRSSDGRDVRAVIAARFRQFERKPASFILMEYVDGVEMGVGAYFNGHEFVRPACLDWEHKRFFPGDLGELTGEMGTVATFDRTERFFAATLARMEPLLRANLYCGYINLNTIVNERGIWPLEFTCRFGYPGFAVLDPLQITSWAKLFRIMTERSAKVFRVRPGFSVGVVLTTRPFPFTRRQIVSEPLGLPVLFDGDLSAADKCQLHYGEVGLERGELVTSGLHGWTMVVTGVGGTIASAQDAAYRLADRVNIPNVRFRRDIGSRLIAEGFARIEHLNLLDEPYEADGATRPEAKEAERDGDQWNAINPSEKSNRAELRRRTTLGPLTKLEEHVPAAWWDQQFDALYLKTDGDVVEDDDITRDEIDLFLRLLPLTPEAKVLDLCCGQGRHILEFFRRGFGEVEGFDRSSFLLSEARKRAKFERLPARFCEGDARVLPYVAETFDAVLILGNSFGYFASAEDDCAMLREAHRVLRPTGRLLLDVTDGEYLKIHFAPRSWEWIDATMFVCRERELSTGGDRLVSREIITDVEHGVLVDRFYAERLYTSEELRQILTRAGFRLADVHSDLITGSARNQDLGMMARRIVLTSCKN